jgi:hypothetical protein
MGNEADSGDTNHNPGKRKEKRDYKGFVAGVFSGVTKLSGEFRVGVFSIPSIQGI